MKHYLLALTAVLFSFSFINGQVTVLEDFEGGSKIGWNTDFGDGVFTVVDNPAVADPGLDPNNINPSAQVGSYVKGETGFSLLISILDDSLDLTTNNRFTMQVYAPVASSFIFKIEGDLGMNEFYEVRQNIATATTERWIEYSFDMSPAANFTTINKIVIFFDPGNETSTDTYLFDNITVGPADECAGTMPVAGVADDFECQRNITVGAGFFDLEVIDNPDASGINTSASVGAFNDSRGGAFHALVYDYGDNGIDLTTLNVIKTKVWAPFTSRVVVKLEGGNSAPVEKDFMIETAEEWVELSVNFSEVAAARYTRLVYFFNAFEEPGEEDIFFIDDVQWEEAPAAPALEDFEEGGRLGWGPLDDNSELNGTFEIIANPDMMGNESANIGSYTKGTSMFSAVSTFLLEGLDLSAFSQLNLQVWAPAGSATVEMQLVSATQGIKSVTRDITDTEQWIELNFNFEEFQSITDFQQLNLLFDGGTAGQGTTYFFDNLRLGASTVDPCEAVEPITGIIDDFDCQRNANIIVGGDALAVINNPDDSGNLNNDPLDKVGEYTDPFGEFDALVYNFGEAQDLSIRNQLTIKVWSPAIVPMLFKLEGGTAAPVEIFVDVTEANTWVEYVIDFSGAADTDHPSLAIFMNAGNVQAEQLIYYLDDISWNRAPYTACVADFESPDFSLDGWGYFPDGDDNPGVAFVENPNKSGINTSDTVGYFFERGNGSQPWAGMFNALDAPIQLPNDNKTIKMKVLGPVAGTIVMKLEGGSLDPNNTGDTPAEYTTPGEWQELTYDFTTSPGPVPDDAQYATLTLIPNIGEIPTVDQDWYFDDIQIASAVCNQSTGIFSPVKVDQLSIAPNPVIDQLLVTNSGNVDRFAIFNTLGQRLKLVQTTGQTAFNINVDDLQKGMYVLAAYDKFGTLVGNAKFVKE